MGKRSSIVHDARLNVKTNGYKIIFNQYIIRENCDKDHTHLKQLYMNMEKRYKKYPSLFIIGP